MTRHACLHLLGAATVLAAGCFSRLTGNEGNFQFAYQADDWITDFNKPIAAGAYLDISVSEVGTFLPVTLDSAFYDDETVLTVDDIAGDVVTVLGVGEGSALLSVEGTTSAGETLTDSVNMLCAVPEVLVLAHTCDVGREAAYLTGQRAWVPFEMQMENSQPVIGYGYYPIDVQGSAMSLVTGQSDQQWMAFDTAGSAGTVTLASQIDDTTLTAEVVAPAAIDGVQDPIALVFEDIDVGDVNAFFVRPLAGDLVVCQADVAIEVASDSPETCDVREIDPAAQSGEGEHEYGWFEVEGLAQGTCLYTVRYPDGNGGEGVESQFSFEIEP